MNRKDEEVLIAIYRETLRETSSNQSMKISKHIFCKQLINSFIGTSSHVFSAATNWRTLVITFIQQKWMVK